MNVYNPRPNKNILLDKFELLHEENVTEYRPDTEKGILEPKQLSPTHTMTKITIRLIAKDWKYFDAFLQAQIRGSPIAVTFDDKSYRVTVMDVHPFVYNEMNNPSIEIIGVIKRDRRPSFEI